MNITDKQLADAERKLLLLLTEAREDVVIHARVQLWIAKFTGGRPLNEWLRDDKVPMKDRLMVARNLVDILIAKTYERLPEIPIFVDPAGVVHVQGEVVSGPSTHELVNAGNRVLGCVDTESARIRAIVRAELADTLMRIAKALAPLL